ncbi:amine oxidase [Plakobranchus ocellatus]|uniref:Amine oxidase n=1 Tax=Plakobranchus ocellatus TaxID=259542 RepID=A0AAV4BIW4_9GAST|nr:amine oxidase [Plakobranchus ocellatus]
MEKYLKTRYGLKLVETMGKKSFKVALSICNLSKPNAKQNTHLIAMAKVPDTTHNMQIMFEDLKPEIESLQSFTWRGKAMKVFIFGDYWFLCKLYGLSGPSGLHPCLWCETNKKDMQKDQLTGSMPKKRSLNSMQENLTQFLASGGGEKSAKHFKNVIYPAMLDTELDAVAPPYLHILLGIVAKHHSHMERDAAILDQKILEERAKLSNLSRKNMKNMA